MNPIYMKVGEVGSGCKSCPEYFTCTADFRSSRCACNRSKHYLKDPLAYGDQFRRMSDHDIANLFVSLKICPDYRNKEDVACSLDAEEMCYECWMGHLETVISEVENGNVK